MLEGIQMPRGGAEALRHVAVLFANADADAVVDVAGVAAVDPK